MMNTFKYTVLVGVLTMVFPCVASSTCSSTTYNTEEWLKKAYENRQGDPDSSIEYANQVIAFLRDSCSSQKAEALRYRGMAKRYKTLYDEAISDYEASLEIEIKNYNPLNQINSLNLIGNIHRIEKRYDEALEFYIKSLKISDVIYPEPLEIGDTYNSMGLIFSIRENFVQAQNYLIKAYQVRRTAYDNLICPTDNEKVTERLAGTYQDFAGMYQRKKSFDTALTMYRKSEYLNKQIDDRYALGKTYNDIGTIYFTLKKYKLAIDYFTKSMTIKKELSDNRGIAITTCNICESYLEQNDYKNALKYCNLSTQYAQRPKDYGVLSNVEFLFYKIAKIKGDSETALAHHEFYVKYKRKLDNNKKDIKIQRIIRKYERDKEEAVTEREEVIKQQNVQQRQSLLTTGMLSTLLMSLVLFFYSRSEKKRRLQEEQLRKETEGRRIEEGKLYNQVIKTLEKDAEIQAVNAEIDARLKERTKVASTLHDSVCSGLVSARMHMESLQNNIAPEDKAVFVRGFGLLNEAYETCREISHDLSPPILAKFGLASAIEDLCERRSTPQTHIQFADTPFDERLNHQQELTLYQSIQELLQNILRHSAATEAHVQLTDYGDSLNILVEDDGKGFDTAEISDSSSGLQRIRTRVKHLGGSMDVDSSPGNGTTVIIDVPKLLVPENGSIS